MRDVLCFLIALVAAPAWAEWVKVGEISTTVVYIDPTTIRKDGDFREIWSVHDLKQIRKDGEMSRRLLMEFDCKEKRVKILSSSSHSEPMASGKILKSLPQPSPWAHVAPETFGEIIIKIVCAK